MLNKLPFLKIPALPAGKYIGQDYLDQKHFMVTLIAALALHVAGLFAWQMMPKVQVIDIPVHALNVKLGGEDTPEDIKTAQPGSENKIGVENVITRLVRDPELDKARSKSITKTMDKAMKALDHSTASKLLDKTITDAVTKPSDIARHYVRQRNQAPAGPADAKNAELVSRYEQLISLWIQKFWIYPEEAKAQKMQGETLVRIRIDRQGTIRYYILEHSTGHQLLDRAAIDMVRRANPVPAVPNNYPPGDLIEFLIPVNYKLQ